MNQTEKLIDLYKEEYVKLKDEQIKRIGFRDNLIYVTLVAVGSVFGFSLTNANTDLVLLIVPWVTFVLGWTYIANDEKISSIGKYLSTVWREKIYAILGEGGDKVEVMGWESFHREDENRKKRKVYQIVIEMSVFVAPGIIVIVFLSFFKELSLPNYVKGLVVIEVFLLVALIYELFKLSDFGKDK